MKKILSVENMRKSDADTIKNGIPGRELMMRAGKAVYENTDLKPPVAIVCGSGNNAGDGYVIARLLHDNKQECTLILLDEKFSEDGKYYYDTCVEAGIPVLKIADIQGNSEEKHEEFSNENCNNDTIESLFHKYSTIVDCIFGTGFRGEVKEPKKSVIKAINKSGAYVVSIDINSGLNGDTGIAAEDEKDPCCVRSDITVSIGDFKSGHFLNMAKDVMKKKINCDIGIKPVDEPFILLENDDFRQFFGKRPEYSNKGSYGYAALIGGSKRYSGAIRLAYMANAAMRSGAGVVKVAVPSSLYEVVASNVLESTLFPLSDEDGELKFSKEEFDELTRNVKTVAFGMGIGVSEETKKALEYLLINYKGRMIVDADGLTILSKMDKEMIKNSRCELILTPHIKEFSRLTGMPMGDILAAPVDTARRYAAEYGVVLLLKGPSTIITDGSAVYITDTGCSGMATAGSGDVLSGILAAVCAYLPEAVLKAGNEHSLAFSAAAGAFINGRAGELAAEKTNTISMIASDTISCIISAMDRGDGACGPNS